MHERVLEPDERKEMKQNQRVADIFTPLLKLVSSEYCNQIAYDALQIHGGTGFMKDFPVERLYRDARITSIYEGTSQLQVVAAIRGVTTDGFLNQIKVYEQRECQPELEFMKKKLIHMTRQYKKLAQRIVDEKDEELLDFHARRLVEMAGNIIMGYLLLNDSMRDEEYRNVAEIFIKKAEASNVEKMYYIKNTEQRDLGIIKSEG
jgi:hypothetical protein